MINFFRNVLDGPLYIVVVVLSTIFIMAIIGFIMERKKLKLESESKYVKVDEEVNIPSEAKAPTESITPVEQAPVVQTNIEPPSVDNNINMNNTNENNSIIINSTDIPTVKPLENKILNNEIPYEKHVTSNDEKIEEVKQPIVIEEELPVTAYGGNDPKEKVQEVFPTIEQPIIIEAPLETKENINYNKPIQIPDEEELPIKQPIVIEEE